MALISLVIQFVPTWAVCPNSLAVHLLHIREDTITREFFLYLSVSQPFQTVALFHLFALHSFSFLHLLSLGSKIISSGVHSSGSPRKPGMFLPLCYYPTFNKSQWANSKESYNFCDRQKRGRKTSMCGCLTCTPYWWPGLQPRHSPWELNQQPFGLQTGAQSTEPHQPGQEIFIK